MRLNGQSQRHQHAESHATMLIPHVNLSAASPTLTQVETISKLSAVAYLFADLPSATLELFATADSAANLTEDEQLLKGALLSSRTIAGPFTAHMMSTAITWLDQGIRKVLVDAESSDDTELQRVATAISELPANRVVLRLPVDTDALADQSSADAYACEMKNKIVRLKDTIGGVVLSLRSAAAVNPIEDDATFSVVSSALRTIRAACDEGFLFAVESNQTRTAQEVSRIAELHAKNIHVVAPALPRATSDSERVKFVDAGLAFVKCIVTDRADKLITTVVVDEAGVALGLVYSSEESILAAIESGRGVYYSRSRKGLWKKGESSGNYQELVQLDLDCDSDALRFMVRQTGAGFCHLNTRTCWGESGGLQHLQSMLESRLQEAPEGSYTKRLFNDPVLLRNKLVEEAQELAEAETRTHVAEEAADVMYFAMVRCVAAGATLADVENQLDMRALKVKRRPGNSKAYRIDAANEILQQQK